MKEWNARVAKGVCVVMFLAVFSVFYSTCISGVMDTVLKHGSLLMLEYSPMCSKQWLRLSLLYRMKH
jgi:hypothetical protein